MRKSRFSEEQIIGMIREHEAGVKTADICRKYGISDATFYKYKARNCQRKPEYSIRNAQAKPAVIDFVRFLIGGDRRDSALEVSVSVPLTMARGQNYQRIEVSARNWLKSFKSRSISR